MLLRICDHFRDNPKRIDKLIAIKGLPKEWFFKETEQGIELKKPWEPDVDKNIPTEIRHLCEPFRLIMRYPPIHNQAKEVIEEKQVLCLRIDYNTEPGRQMWDDVERYIEESTPRNERIPVPVVCAKDERSAFETYTPRRNSRGSLELVPSPVPLVDLTKYVEVRVEPKPAENVPVATFPETLIPQKDEFKCSQCDRVFGSEHALKIHRSRPSNHKKEKVGAT